MVFDVGSVILYIIGLFILYLFCWIFIKPIKWLFKLGISCVLGALAIGGMNFLAGGIGWHIALNPLTAMIAGVLGLPGMVLSIILTNVL